MLPLVRDEAVPLVNPLGTAASAIGMKKEQFRLDINGLRAWAVGSVVLFHFGVPGFQGGFVGVDVFFVISGFLMTRIIADGLMQSRSDHPFSIARFYLARAMRIAPALIVLCGVVLVCGAVLLPSTERQLLGRHVVASLLFVSNITSWKEAGYFDASSLDKWLLHTWSLSLEWQFYLILPVLFAAVWRLRPGKNALIWLSLAGLVASLFLSIIFTPTKPSSAFYLLPSRSWELSAGGLLYLLGNGKTISARSGRILEALGFALILGAVLLFSGKTSWPGWRATLPVCGTVLVLLAARIRSLWTSPRPVQWIGERSYSIYLWHWPIIVALAYFDLQDEGAALVAGIAMALLLGDLSYRWVEIGWRSAIARAKPLQQLRSLGLAAAVVVVPGSFVAAHGPSPPGNREEAASAERDAVMVLSSNGWCFRNVESSDGPPLDGRQIPCVLGDSKSTRNGLLIGDSFAGQYEPFWDRVGRETGSRVESITTNWCFPSQSDDFLGTRSSPAYAQCKIDRTFLRNNLGKYDFVVFAGLWRSVFDLGLQQGLYDAIDQASRRVRWVVVMAAPVEFDRNVNKQYQRRIAAGRDFDIKTYPKTMDRIVQNANASIAAYAKRFDNVVFIDRDSIFNIDGSPGDVTRDNVPYSLDGSHISIYGSKKAAEAFLQTPLYRQLKARLEAK